MNKAGDTGQFPPRNKDLTSKAMQTQNGWHKVRQGGLTVLFAQGQDGWPAVAAAYWRGAYPGLVRVTSSRFAVVERGEGPSSGELCYFKRYLMRNLKDRFKHLVLPPRAARAQAGALLLESCGFRAPVTLCAIIAKRWGLVTGSALVTKAEECPSARELLQELSKHAVARHDKRRLLEMLGNEMGRMHGCGIYHGDTNLGNILVRIEKGKYAFLWLDNERVKQFPHLPIDRRLENLRQLNKESHFLTAGDRMRFWKAYRQNARLGNNSREVLHRAVAIITEYWRQQN